MTDAACVTTTGMLPVILMVCPKPPRQSALLYRQLLKMPPSVLHPQITVQKQLLKPDVAIRKNAIALVIASRGFPSENILMFCNCQSHAGH